MSPPTNPAGIPDRLWQNMTEEEKDAFRAFPAPGYVKPQSSNTIIAPTNNVANTTFNGSGTTSLARNKYFGLNGPEAQGFFA